MCLTPSGSFRIGTRVWILFLGTDLTDYFNYGFTEDTWRAYINKQKEMRNPATLKALTVSNWPSHICNYRTRLRTTFELFGKAALNAEPLSNSPLLLPIPYS